MRSTLAVDVDGEGAQVREGHDHWVASLVGGLSVSPGMLIASRAVQGVGAALLSPAALALLNSTYAQGPARNRALAVWGGTAGSGAAAGVLLGGVLTSALGWQWVLLVNIPIVVVAVLAAPALLADGRDEGPPRSFDLPGALLVTTGLVALMYAGVSIESAGPGSAQTLLVLAVGVVSLAAFVAAERRAAAPLMPLGVFRERNLHLASGVPEQAATADGIARAFGVGAAVLAVGAVDAGVDPVPAQPGAPRRSARRGRPVTTPGDRPPTHGAPGYASCTSSR